MEAGADDLLQTAARVERKSFQNEVDRAAEWLSQRLADGPLGSVICAREGDKSIGRIWPAPGAGLPPDEQRKRVLGRVKWWRETILKPCLKGESARAGFNGPYFFRLPDHLTRGLWPPSSEAIRAAQHADDGETRPDLQSDPWTTTVTRSAPVEAARGSQTNKAASTDSTDPTVHLHTEQAERASTDSTEAKTSAPRSVEAVEATDRVQASTVASTDSTDSPREIFEL